MTPEKQLNKLTSWGRTMTEVDDDIDPSIASNPGPGSGDAEFKAISSLVGVTALGEYPLVLLLLLGMSVWKKNKTHVNKTRKD